MTQTPWAPHGFATGAADSSPMQGQPAEGPPKPLGFRAKGPGFLVWDQDEQALRTWASELRRAAPLPASFKVRRRSPELSDVSALRHEREARPRDLSGRSSDGGLLEPSHSGLETEKPTHKFSH